MSGCEHGECVPVPFRRRLREKRASRWGGGFQTGVEPGVPSWLWSMVAAGGEVLWVGGCVRVGLSFVGISDAVQTGGAAEILGR